MTRWQLMNVQGFYIYINIIWVINYVEFFHTSNICLIYFNLFEISYFDLYLYKPGKNSKIYFYKGKYSQYFKNIKAWENLHALVR